MTEPENTEPAVVGETVTDSTPVTEPVTADDSVTAEEASDAQLRAWAKDNGIEGVPSRGALSSTWREQITSAMAAALTADPKVEVSAEGTPSGLSTSSDTATTETSTGEKISLQTEPEPVVEYRSVFRAPNTFVSSQHYTF